MHLRSVTLRGFKSFAERTVIEFDPGLIALVGPNGAGKSNLVDALVWALGTLSARALRAERMEDVIFTGTNQRKALGMAQVTLTFDNTSGAFPVDVAEVSVGRTLYRDGASEYSLNGAPCRLLDVQDLMSEAGIGRELHAVVAQGQVDEIVGSRPEELRSHVEEAAGISKHRRRAERAMRKIDHVTADIERAADLASEVRRQIKPLKAQASQALRYREVTEALRELGLRLAVAGLESLERERAQAVQTRSESEHRLQEVAASVETLRQERAAADAAAAQARADDAGARRGLEHLRAGQAAALRAVVALRERARAAPDARRRAELQAKLDELDKAEASVRAELDEAARAAGDTEAAVAAARAAAAEARQELASRSAELKETGDQLREVAVEARGAEQQAIAARAEAAGAADRVARAGERLERLAHQADEVRRDIERLDAEGGRAALHVERLQTERTEAQTAFEEADARLRTVESEAAVLAGRLESLRVARDLAASRRRGAEALRHRSGVDLGSRGILADGLRVPSGFERAVEAALGPALDALVVAGAKLPAAVEAAEASGGEAVVVPTLAQEAPRTSGPRGLRGLTEIVEAPSWLRGTIDALLENVYLADDWDEATAAAVTHPEATFVTPSGRMLRPRGVSSPARPGSAGSLGVTEALERTEEAATRAEAERRRWTGNRDRHRRDVERLTSELEAARSVLNEVEGRIAAAADRLRELKAEEHGASLERELAGGDRDERLRRAEEAHERRVALEARREVLAAREATLAREVSDREARVAELEGRVGDASEQLTERVQARASLAERLRGVVATREELRAESQRAAEPPPDPGALEQAERMLAKLDEVTARTTEQSRARFGRTERAEEQARAVAEDLSRAEVQLASLRPRAEAAAEAVARLDAAIEEAGTQLAATYEVPPARAREEFPSPPDVDAARREFARLEAELRRMGPVNPLAAEEIVGLEERQAFLEAQIEDLRRSKRDLMRLVRVTEERMRELLEAAVRDADERFREVVALLFPEGDGRLRLCGDDDPLQAGVEIEVRLGRKGHRKLAFLSGGEKALAGLGFLFALHLARPTPFLVLDEVDAPLDDANLGRFLRLLDALRTKTQVLVITHQKRTMERADSLVGVTLHPDGTSRVVTQNVRELAEATTRV